MIPDEKIKEIINKYNLIETELSSGNLNSKLYADKSKEYSELKSIIETAQEYLNYYKTKKDLEELSNDTSTDEEMKILAKKELKTLNLKREENESKLKIFLLPKDLDDQKNAIVEIRAGTGGLEATLFCSDLFKMYEKVCSKKKMEVRDYKYF